MSSRRTPQKSAETEEPAPRACSRPGVSCSSVAGAREKLLDFALAFPETASDRPWEDDVVVEGPGEDLRLPRAGRLAPDLAEAGGVARARARDRGRAAHRLRSRALRVGDGTAPCARRLARRPPRLGRGELPDRRAEEARRSARRLGEDRPDDRDPRSHAASARRSSTVEPRSVSWRSKSPAQSDERSGSASRLAAVARPSSARTSTASSR